MQSVRRKQKIVRILLYALVFSLAFIVAFPFFWMILASFKDIKEFYVLKPKLFPEKFSFANYTELVTKLNIPRYYLNSILVTTVQVLANVVIVLMAGYGFAKYQFRGKNFLFIMVLSSTMIPWVATIIPLYIMANNLHLVDTMMGLIIPGMADAFSIFLARNFISSVPTPLLEAARIDGGGETKIFLKVVIPLIKPLISVITIQKMVSSWNAFQWPLLVVNSDELRTLPLAIAKLSSQYYDAYNLKLAAATLTIIPVLIVYIVFQKYIVEGVSLSGIK
ncbi:MAG: carbohydrate ABC transporter permease [Lachnospiraceae bacterium]|nr:carbohydrate ABC transporter permease [Lachnospiraceae bacterium]